MRVTNPRSFGGWTPWNERRAAGAETPAAWLNLPWEQLPCSGGDDHQLGRDCPDLDGGVALFADAAAFAGVASLDTMNTVVALLTERAKQAFMCESMRGMTRDLAS